jgi:hypothetical protein
MAPRQVFKGIHQILDQMKSMREFGNEGLVNEVIRAVSKNARRRLCAVRARMPHRCRKACAAAARD